MCALTKACIIFQTRKIPPNLNYSKPNPNIKGLMDGKMVPVTKTTDFKGNLIPVNCFGFGGANIHVLAESYDWTDFEGGQPKITHPMARIIQVCGRTAEAVNFMMNGLRTDSQYWDINFLSLLDRFATQPYQRGFGFRSYLMVTTDSFGNYKFENADPSAVKSKVLNLIFNNENNCEEEDLMRNNLNQLQAIEMFADAKRDVDRILKQLKVELNGRGSTHKSCWTS